MRAALAVLVLIGPLAACGAAGPLDLLPPELRPGAGPAAAPRPEGPISVAELLARAKAGSGPASAGSAPASPTAAKPPATEPPATEPAPAEPPPTLSFVHQLDPDAPEPRPETLLRLQLALRRDLAGAKAATLEVGPGSGADPIVRARWAARALDAVAPLVRAQTALAEARYAPRLPPGAVRVRPAAQVAAAGRPSPAR